MSDYSLESIDRIEKIKKLKEAWVIVYANNYHWKIDISEIVKNTSNLKEVEFLQENWAESKYKTAWRLMSYKSHWKLAFAKIMDHTTSIQICFMKDKFKFNTWKEVIDSLVIDSEEKSAYKISEKFINVWDYIWVVWELFFTKHWELTLFVNEFQILAKAIRPLPEKFHWITDEETIYRQRYLDLIMNDESYGRLKLRSKYMKVLRDFYYENNFIEIETPVLWNAASGAAAAPFITHHNDFWEDFYLRISPETSLKKATVWRFERVVEFARDFRNEWSDPSHMQEFTMIEHYASWWNFEDNMKFIEEMFDYIFKNMPELKKEVMVKDKQGNEKLVNFQTPWVRIDYVEWVKWACWIDVSKYFIWDEKKLIADIKSAWVEFEWMDKMVVPTLIDYLYKKVLRPWIIWPAIVYNYPKTMQPLARQSDENPKIVEQFQVVVNGWEIIKAYSELVDPEIQKANFDAQSTAKEMWDEEATSGDDDFLLAMEYAMPPQSWLWMWIERSFSMLTWQENLRDVVLFPLMRSEKKNEEAKKSKETKVAVAIINKASKLELWQELNTIWHLSSAFAARVWKDLFMQDTIKTSDWNNIKLNIQHAIVIKESNNQKAIVDVIAEAKELWLEVSEFTREMLITSDDKKVAEMTSGKNFQDIEYLWALVFGSKKLVDGLTKDFTLYWENKDKNIINSNDDKKDEDYSTLKLPTLDEAMSLVDKYSTNTKKHLISVWYVMKYFAEKLWQNELAWQLVWLLHDIDWDYIEKDWNKHCKEELEKITSEINLPHELVNDIKSHWYWLTWVKPDSLIRKYICSVDELTWFIVAVSKMMPNKTVDEVKSSSVLKKIKDKWFAAWVSREEVMNCETMLWISLEEFVEETIKALQKYKSHFE